MNVFTLDYEYEKKGVSKFRILFDLNSQEFFWPGNIKIHLICEIKMRNFTQITNMRIKFIYLKYFLSY